MKTIEVRESALESLKAMTQKLHRQNEILLSAHKDIAAETYDTWTNGYRAQQISLNAIAACQESTKVLES